MFEYFYHEILRKTVVSFGTLFNNITIKHTDSSGNVESVLKVPLAYGPTQKFLARLEQSPDLSKKTQISLPRMSFEFVSLTYDPTRKVTTTQTFLTRESSNKTEVKKVYMPVPYNMQFELNIYTKLNEDMLQIIEQILPYFQPSYSMTVDLIDSINEKRDIPVVLENITMSDDYEGNFDQRRALIYTLRFTAKTYLFGPVSSGAKDAIKKVSIGLVSGDSTPTPKREVIYTAELRAIKNYTGQTIATLSEDLNLTKYVFSVVDASQITAETYIVIDSEEMYVKSIAGNQLTVLRGSDDTPVTEHVSGTAVKSITSSDNALVEVGDDFGFSGSV